jgi:hypothetical protein
MARTNETTPEAQTVANVPLGSAETPPTKPVPSKSDPEQIYRRGDFWFYFGCIVCGSWALGPIGAPMLVVGMLLIRKAQKAGFAIRPWTVTVVGGLILVDSAANGLAWGFDFFAHDTWVSRTLWTGYGQLVDGGFALFYNSGSIVGGLPDHGERALELATVLVAMPIRGIAAWGLLKMKRWGLQWSIVGNWMYVIIWMVYSANQYNNFEFRFGTSDFGVIGFWLVAGIPFCGPMILLPYLHTVNKELWT